MNALAGYRTCLLVTQHQRFSRNLVSEFTEKIVKKALVSYKSAQWQFNCTDG